MWLVDWARPEHVLVQHAPFRHGVCGALICVLESSLCHLVCVWPVPVARCLWLLCCLESEAEVSHAPVRERCILAKLVGDLLLQLLDAC